MPGIQEPQQELDALGRKAKRLTCPFSLIYKKAELQQSGNDKKIHPAIKDPGSEEALSQGGGIGVYYLAKFRGLHNHPLESNLFDRTQQGGLTDEPSTVTQRGERYTHAGKRFVWEKTAYGHHENQAKLEVLANAAHLRRELGDAAGKLSKI